MQSELLKLQFLVLSTINSTFKKSNN
jgi:hypothetical protein